MTEPKPIACSLGASDLRRRLDKIASLGGESLIASEARGETRLLRFRRAEETRRRLAEIVAAEAECCPFLDLDLHERDGELVLTVAAREDGQVLADELASAFMGGSR
jgi:MerR family copper efflux transcriptional regulator